MKTDEVIEMAKEAGFNPQSLFMKSKLEAFAKLVAAKHDPKIAIADAYRAGVDSGIAAEREACALQLEASANQIRSRLGGLTDEDHVCIGVLVYEAKQIRARGEA